MKHLDTLIMLHNLLETYEFMCSPVYRSANLTQNAFNILMFLANNPEYSTARDISRIHGIKPNIVSFSVEKLVKEGFIERIAVPTDRRKIRLVCTKKAGHLIEHGHIIQNNFYQGVFAGLTDADLQAHFKCMEQIYKNAEYLRTQWVQEGRNEK